MKMQIKRIYEPVLNTDGYRILIDRLWPRGITKEKAHIDKWMKEIAPSTALRKWFNHDPGKWEQFCTEYHAELRQSPALDELMSCLRKHKMITLLFSARSEKHNHALALQQFIEHDDARE